METYVVHGESPQIFLMKKKTKLGVNFKCTIVLIDVPFCNENEKVSKQLLRKLKVFTKGKYDFRFVWKTKKVKQLFPLKEKNSYPSYKIYEEVRFCK